MRGGEGKEEGKTRNDPPSLLLGRYYQWPGSWEQLRLGPWMWSSDKEMDEETVALICSLAPPCFQGSAGLARSAVSVRDHNGIGLWMCRTDGGGGFVTPWNRILGFILLATLSACGETKGLCSTVTYQITAKLTMSHSKHTKDETPHHQERSRKEEKENK